MRVVYWGILFLLLLSVVSALPVTDVKLTGYVNDYANILTPQEESQITYVASSLREQGAAELAVVTVDNFNGLTKEEYAITIAHEKLGDTQKDNGLLILIGMEEHEYRVEVGYGLEGDLNDAKIGRLARETLIPYFQQGQYGAGILGLTEQIHNELLPDSQIQATVQPVVQRQQSFPINFWTIFLIIMIVRGISGAIFRKKGKKENDSDIGNAFATAFLASMLLGGRGGNGGMGGFGGFGGGGFGGGGAGGSW